MISLAVTRAAVTTTLQQFQLSKYPTMLVNYPNLGVVDLEHQTDPFISVEIDLSKVKRASTGGQDMVVPGTLRVYYYFREGTGTRKAYEYSDGLSEVFAMNDIGDISYDMPRPIPVKTFAGWEGLLLTVPFTIAG